VADANGNPMAAGTKITAGVSGTGVSLAQGSPSSYTYPDTTEPISYGFTIALDSKSAVAGSNASIILTIVSAGGVTTSAGYTIPIVP
jgi:hypothetical protein